MKNKLTRDLCEDLLNENYRNELQEKIENYIDDYIKFQLLNGSKKFYVSTGKYTTNGHIKTGFYGLWLDTTISEESLREVQKRVMKTYEKIGFKVKVIDVDHGWHSSYEALDFEYIDDFVVDNV